jgi:hypothetical protein
MSALVPKADIRRTACDVRFVPKRALPARPLFACLVLKAANRSANEPGGSFANDKTFTADNGGDADLGGSRNSAKAPSPSQ